MKLSRLFLAFVLLLASCTSPEILGSTDGKSTGSVTIGYAEPLSSYSPLSYEAVNRRYLCNMYEGLVRYDGTFNYETALAVSWGRLDDTTWDFRLREGVTFHDGSVFDADDVLYSLQIARESGSELSALLSTIVEVNKTDTYRLQIKTSRPDPLLLNKLTYVYMVPSGYSNFDLPIGTGPYRVSQFVDDTLVLERYDEYWGALAYFAEARLSYIPDPQERLDAFLSGEVQVLANVPPQYVEEIEAAGASVEDFPSLEVSYLLLNTAGPFANEHLRAAVWNALGIDYTEQFGGGYLLPTSQYAALGITGYDSSFEDRAPDLETALAERALVDGPVSLTLELPQGLEVLGTAIQEDLAAIDITVTVSTTGGADYEDKISSGLSDFYFFGWKYDLADSEDFFDAVIHTPTGAYGEFNHFAYSNPQLDSLIEGASTQLQSTQRRMILEEISMLLLADQVVLPLFESQVLYAVHPSVYYDFRLDGQLWASEIVENVLK
jgi:peptide/nickel transport system substrate-binding protein